MTGACVAVFMAYSSRGDENVPAIVLGALLLVAVIVFVCKEWSGAVEDLRKLREKVGEADGLMKKAAAECASMHSKAAEETSRMTREVNENAAKIVSEASRKTNDLIAQRMLIADTKIKTREEQLHRVNEEYWEKREEVEESKHLKQITHEIMCRFASSVRKEFGGKALRYMADGYAQALIALRDEVWYYLDMSKLTKADERRKAERQRRIESEKELAYYSGLVAMYESAVPWLADLREPAVPVRVSGDDKQEDADEARAWLQYLSDDEWERMSAAERNQLALDRYIQSRKSNAEIGRDYEQFIGWKYEQDGWDVQYHGMVEGVDDLGRDLICKKENTVQIVQCKCWKKSRTVNECHVNQLFGTFVEYAKANKCKTDFYDFSGGTPSAPRAGAVFVTSTFLSPVAARFAEALRIIVRHDVTLGDFPRIKCNIGKGGEKIYHLPFDQQYNRTVIDRSKGEFYAWRTDEAETQGFRRARKHFTPSDTHPRP